MDWRGRGVSPLVSWNVRKATRLAPAKGQAAHSLTDQSRLLEVGGLGLPEGGETSCQKSRQWSGRRWRGPSESLDLSASGRWPRLPLVQWPLYPPTPHWLVRRRRERERDHFLSFKTLRHIRMALESFSRISKQLAIHANTTSRVRGWIEGGESIADFAFEKINKMSHKFYLNIYILLNYFNYIHQIYAHIFILSITSSNRCLETFQWEPSHSTIYIFIFM